MEIVILIAGMIAGGVVAWFMARMSLKMKMVDRSRLDEAISAHTEEKAAFTAENSRVQARYEASLQTVEELKNEVTRLKEELSTKTSEFNELNSIKAQLTAENKALDEKLQVQKKEIEEMGRKFNTEFENIANRILDEKSSRFTTQNQENLKNILKPLGENIENFRKKVEEVYSIEAKERFSLGKELERLVELNQRVSEEANNLTRALKGSAKIQGDWGEMVLKNILEQSGLEEGREYFVQEYLKDEDGNKIRNEQGQRMRPDVIIQYPDNRKVIVDSKVSLVAYTRYTEAADETEQKKALREHIDSLKKHVDSLSNASYHEYGETLDFVMMFVPVEPAYLLALKEDSNLWGYAYRKKILLISPTNLIAALKLIEDLWKREHQHQNTQAIADRGSQLYDKFVSFVENLENLGKHLDKAQGSYNDAFGQLKSGRGNLIGQAEKLRQLGVKTRKNLPPSLLEISDEEE